MVYYSVGYRGNKYIDTCLVPMYLKGDRKSELTIGGTHCQGWFMYTRYTQGHNEEHLLSTSMY